MLDPWIIEEIRRREEEQRRDDRLPAVIELPVLRTPSHSPPSETGKPADDEGTDRGVAIIDFSVY